MAAVKLAEILAHLAEGQSPLRQASAMAAWAGVVDARLGGKTEPLRVSRGVLWVAVPSSTWVNELTLLKPQLLARLKEKLRGKVVRDLHFVVGPAAREEE